MASSSTPARMNPQRQGPAAQPLTTKADVKLLGTYVNELCQNWEYQLTIMLSTCTTMAKWQERWALFTATLIIVLNVLVVAAPEIHLKDEIVTGIVIVNTVLLTVQLRCKFAVRANELHEANAELQSVLQKVRHIKVKGRCLGCSLIEVHKCEALVEEAINHIPCYANAKQSLPGWKEFGVKKGSHEKYKVPEDEASQSGLNRDVETAAVGRHLVNEGIHRMQLAPTIDTFAAGAPESLLHELHKRTIEVMLTSVDGAVKSATFFSSLFRVISYSSTVLELIMNALIMTFNEVFAPDSEAVAVFAAIAAVIKGIDMKLEMDTKQKQAELVLRKFVVLQEFIKEEQCNLTTGPLDPDAYDHLLHQYQTAVSSYAVWLPTNSSPA